MNAPSPKLLAALARFRQVVSPASVKSSLTYLHLEYLALGHNEQPGVLVNLPTELTELFRLLDELESASNEEERITSD